MSSAEQPPFGAMLVQHRAAAGLTQEQLAARAGLSPDAIAALELDERARTQFVAAARGVEASPATGPSGAAPGGEQRPAGDVRHRFWWLTSQPTPLVDRAHELELIIRLIRDEGVRLLTLSGPAGVGKTRLALAAAAQLADAPDHFADGVTLVDLTPVRDPALVAGAIARALGLLDVSNRPLLERLVVALAQRPRLLVVLDNFEQVLPAAALLADLLAACPHLALLVTSRVPLQLRWEQTLRIAPLPVPDLRESLPPTDVLLAVPSVELFVTRARARRADFVLSDRQAPLVAELAVQLDGLPLALELAAARLDVLPLPTLARRFGSRLRLLTVEAPDLPERQRSLEAAVGWSYDLLSDFERQLFRCLGVFVGRVTLDAIAAVVSLPNGVTAAGPDSGDAAARDGARTLRGLLSLAEKSLVLPWSTRPNEPEGANGQPELWGRDGGPNEPEDGEDLEPAFGMLETVREYAEERLAEAGELVAARRAHAYYFLALAERADHKLRGPDQRAWWLRLEREHDNLRAALRWLLDQDDAAERAVGLRLAGALGWFWAMFGYHAEGVRWLEEALARAPHTSDPGHRTRALVPLGAILAAKGETQRVRAALLEALTLAEGRDPVAAAQARMMLGNSMHIAGEQEEGTRLMQEALRRWEALGDPWGVGLTLCVLGLAAYLAGDMVAAVANFTAGLPDLEAAGDAHQAGYYHCFHAVAAWKCGDLRHAMAEVQAGLRTSLAFRDRWLLSMAAQATLAIGWAHAQPEPRVRLLGAADALLQATGAAFPGEPGGQEVVALRQRLAREGEGEEQPFAAAYQAGRRLSFDAAATLAWRLLDEAARALPDQEAAPGGGQSPERPSRPADRSPLTPREREVLRLVAQGLSSKAIGRQLFLAPSTVNYHLTSVFNKLGVDTRAQAVAVAAQRGLL